MVPYGYRKSREKETVDSVVTCVAGIVLHGRTACIQGPLKY